MAAEIAPQKEESHGGQSMSADSYQTTDMFFAAARLYLFGRESLDKIYMDGSSRATFVLKVPSLDAAEYFNEFEPGQLAVSDLKSLCRQWGFLGNVIRKMKREDTVVWPHEPKKWYSGRQRV